MTIALLAHLACDKCAFHLLYFVFLRFLPTTCRGG